MRWSRRRPTRLHRHPAAVRADRVEEAPCRERKPFTRLPRRGSPWDARPVPGARHGPQGRRGRQRRDPLPDPAPHRPGRARPAHPAGEGGPALGARALRVAERAHERGGAGAGRPAPPSATTPRSSRPSRRTGSPPWPGSESHPPRTTRSPAASGESAIHERKGSTMAIGPVQLLVLGFSHPDFHGEVIQELERLKETDTVRVIDSLAVYKDAEGNIEVEHLSNLTADEAVELGSKVGALVGLGIDGEEGFEAGAVRGAEEAADGIAVFSDDDAWDVLAEIPNDSAAALILLEHHWAVPLRDAIARAGGFRISDGFISPLDLVEIGLLTAAEVPDHALD